MGNEVTTSIINNQFTFKGINSDDREVVKAALIGQGADNFRNFYENDDDLNDFFFNNSIPEPPFTNSGVNDWVNNLDKDTV
jgi:hypothetical protein